MICKVFFVKIKFKINEKGYGYCFKGIISDFYVVVNFVGVCVVRMWVILNSMNL